MKTVCLIPLLLVLLSACAHLPEIRTVQDGAAKDRITVCTEIFLRGQWELVHSIEFLPPVGSKQTLLGIVKLSSEQRAFHCVLMTIEGLVVFEADYDGSVKVRRALPPMDMPGMAEGIVHDISLIFLAPPKPSIKSGFSKDESWICRYPSTGGGMEDVFLRPDGLWEIRLYNKGGNLVRRISPVSREDLQPGGLPARVTLKAYGIGGYELSMTLIEATPVGK